MQKISSGETDSRHDIGHARRSQVCSFISFDFPTGGEVDKRGSQIGKIECSASAKRSRKSPQFFAKRGDTL